MSEMWKKIFSLSISGTIVILGISLFCLFFRKKISRRWQYYIWLAAVIRLLLPISGGVNLVGSAFAGLESRPSLNTYAVSDMENPTEAAEGIDISSISDGQSRGTVFDQEGALPFRLATQFGVIWLLTALFLLVRKVIVYRSFVRSVIACSSPADMELLESFGKAAEEKHIRRHVELYINEHVSSPLLIGFWRAKVILPTKELSGSDLYYTAFHELTHLCRRDLLYKWLVQITVCIHWFNPFVWFMERQVNRACELACDESVLKGRTEEERRAYGNVLLRAAAAGVSRKSKVGALTMHESGKLLKERLEAVIEGRKHSLWYRVLSFLLTVILTAGGFSLGAYAGPKEKEAVFESGGNDFLLSDGTQVIQRDQVFYILCDQMTEEDLGSKVSGGSVGGTQIVTVYKDHFASITLSEEPEALNEEAQKICAQMLEKGMLSRDDADRMIETAAYIQDQMTVQSEADRPYNDHFIQSIYYQEGILFYLGYDLKGEKISNYAGNEITLENGEHLYVSFASSDKEWIEDEAFLNTLRSLFSEFRQRTGKRVSRIKYPLISNIEYVGTDVEALAAKYLAEDDRNRFQVIFQELDRNQQEVYLKKAFEDKNAAFFFITLSGLYRSGNLAPELLDSYAAETLGTGETDFFFILTGYMDQEMQERWYTQLLEERGSHSPFTMILGEQLGYLNEEDYEKFWEYDSDSWDF